MTTMRSVLGVLFVFWILAIISLILYESSTRESARFIEAISAVPQIKPKIPNEEIKIANEMDRKINKVKEVLNKVKNNIQIEKQENLKDDITFVFGIFDIGRKEHMGKSGAEYSFVNDYVYNLNKIINLLQPKTYVKVFIEKKYAEYVKIEEPYDKYLSITHYEIEDLRNFKYYERLEQIRTDPSWIANTPWLAGVPQGYSDLYNPIVMQKLFFLKRAADENFFKTKKFVWLDSGGICVPTLPLYGAQYQKMKFDFWLRDDKFFITRSPYPNKGEIHGCHQRQLIQFTNGYEPQHVCKGWVMGGTKPAIDNLVVVYDQLLNDTLAVNCLGTEETLFTLAYETHPELFNIYSNSEPHDEWADNCCKFFVEPIEDQRAREIAVGWRV